MLIHYVQGMAKTGAERMRALGERRKQNLELYERDKEKDRKRKNERRQSYSAQELRTARQRGRLATAKWRHSKLKHSKEVPIIC